MSHDPHEGPVGAILYDGCAECDERAKDPLMGLLSLDSHSFRELWDRVVAVEFTTQGRYMRETSHQFHTELKYLTENERKLGKAMYRICILLERHPGVIN